MLETLRYTSFMVIIGAYSLTASTFVQPNDNRNKLAIGRCVVQMFYNIRRLLITTCIFFTQI